MHPALSVIFFTVISGAGYGLLFLVGWFIAVDPHFVSRNEALFALGTGAVLTLAGLFSSMLHLGQPQRAWRAFSQWRSSWLSREGVAALVTFIPILALAWCEWAGADRSSLRGLALLLAVMAALTVFCTARIYTSLKTIPAWHNRYVLIGYLMFAVLGGGTLLWMLAAQHGEVDSHVRRALPFGIFTIAVACANLKWSYWRSIDRTQGMSTLESATGLGRFGTVRSAEAPHTEENYLTREMGFALARKHAQKLRRIALVLVGLVPALLALPAWLLHPTLDTAYAMVALASVTAGTFVERWLFFAEAKHVVMLYYGDARPNRA